MFQKELRIPARPTEGPQPFPEELDGFIPNLQQLNTHYYGCDYNQVTKGGHIGNAYQLRPHVIDIKGVYTFITQLDEEAFAYWGIDLLYIIDVNNRTYEVKESEKFRFDEDDYLEIDEEDRMVVIFGFEGVFKDESERT